jgi:hypothetical protein
MLPLKAGKRLSRMQAPAASAGPLIPGNPLARHARVDAWFYCEEFINWLILQPGNQSLPMRSTNAPPRSRF